MVLPYTRMIGPLWLNLRWSFGQSHLREMEEIISLHVTDYERGVNEGGIAVLCDGGVSH
jgi:hypothetical protein